MKYTHNRHGEVIEIDTDAMSKDDLILYASHRTIWNSKEEAEIAMKPLEVRTGTGLNDVYYL